MMTDILVMMTDILFMPPPPVTCWLTLLFCFLGPNRHRWNRPLFSSPLTADCPCSKRVRTDASRNFLRFSNGRARKAPSLWTTSPGGWAFHRSQFIIWARPNYKLVVAKLPQLSWPGGCCYIRPNVTTKNFGSKDHHQHLLSAWEPCFSMSQEYLLPRSNDSVMIKMLRGTSILWWPSLLDLKLLHTNSVPLTSIILPTPVPQGFWHKTLWSMFLEDTYLIS